MNTCLTLITAEGTRALEVLATGQGSRGTLADTLATVGEPLNTRCAQRGLCNGCFVELKAGSVEEEGRKVEGPKVLRACRTCLLPGTSPTLEVPERSRLGVRPQVQSSFKTRLSVGKNALGLSEGGAADLGLAIDLGTTTVVVLLVELRTGNILAEATGFNKQVKWGDDVLTRIQLGEQPGKRRLLQEAVLGETLDPLIREACLKAGRESSCIGAATLAGNTTMLHLLVGADPSPLGRVPFTPAFLRTKVVPAGNLGEGACLRALSAETPLYLLPGMSAYVGADLTAGLFCTGMVYEEGPSLLVDVGTNGEILLAHKGQLWGCATAAGPAFEGVRLGSGTRAVEGAVNRVRFAESGWPLQLTTIGDTKVPIGICGTAYIDFLAQGRRTGALSASGRFEETWFGQLPGENRLQNRLGRAVSLDGTQTTRVSEADLAQLLQAKAAIAAGILSLLKRAGLKVAEVQRLYLAGGFGMNLDLGNAIEAGLLPGFRPEQIDIVGNTSLGGAWLALCDRGLLQEMEACSRRVMILELNLEPGFEDLYIDQLCLA